MWGYAAGWAQHGHATREESQCARSLARSLGAGSTSRGTNSEATGKVQRGDGGGGGGGLNASQLDSQQLTLCARVLQHTTVATVAERENAMSGSASLW